jgi:hypothetical protein
MAMTAAFVQNLSGNTDNTSTQTFAVVPGANATAGNTLVMGLLSEDGAPVGITDTKGNTWSKLVELNAATYGIIQVWSTPQNGGAVTTGDTITVDRATTFNRPTNWSLDEFSGVASSSPLDQSGTANNTAATQTVTAAGATVQADELAYVFFDGINATALTFDALLTPTGAEVNSAVGGNGSQRTRAAYAILSATGTPSYADVRTGGAKAITALVTFKAGGAAPAAILSPIQLTGPSYAASRAASI